MKQINIGQRFGKLVVISFAGTHKGTARWDCKCDCSRIASNVRGTHLRSGDRISCGCAVFDPRRKDLVGCRFGHLLVLSPARVRDTYATWNCQCDCGNTAIVSTKHLTSNKEGQGRTRSCGCLKTKPPINKEHGQARTGKMTRIYQTWLNMKSRCKPNHEKHRVYYDRGIAVCDAWTNSFEEFYVYVITNLGLRPSRHHSLDRIDNDGNYEPGNIRWATKKQQSANQRPRKDSTLARAQSVEQKPPQSVKIQELRKRAT
jgi:hypothetical protein